MSRDDHGGQEQVLPPALDGTEQRLDAILAELRAMRAQMQAQQVEGDAEAIDKTIRLREPPKPTRRRA